MASRPPSYRVVEEVAREDGDDPTELSPPLNTVIDSEALDRLVQADAKSDGNPVEILFEYRNYLVRVRGGPSVSVTVEGAVDPVECPDSMV